MNGAQFNESSRPPRSQAQRPRDQEAPRPASTPEPNSSAHAAADPNPEMHPWLSPTRVALWLLVLLGVAATTLAGFVLFYNFAWLQTQQGWSWTGDFFANTSGQQLFDAARTSVTIVGIIGLGGAALITYRKQHTTEQTHKLNTLSHQTSVEAQRTAAAAVANSSAQLQLDSKKYELDTARHEVELERRREDRDHSLRHRYGEVTAQLGSTHFAVRCAGAYALASLADEWRRFQNKEQRQICVSVLCAYLRSSDPTEQLPGEREVRSAIVQAIASHTRPASDIYEDDDENSWITCEFDLAGADLTRADLHDSQLNETSLAGADLTGANLSGTNLSDSNMAGAVLQGADLRGTVLTHANLAGAILVDAKLDGANLEHVRYSDRTRWPTDYTPPPSAVDLTAISDSAPS
ncbi:pentapeptide repeat-containing protein [Rhodococcus koreensis]